MAAKKRGLGRGLDALLGGAKLDAPADRLRQIPIEKLGPSEFQPRKAFDSAKLRELADSISAQGMVQPVVVREIDGDRFEIIAGERRWRAAQLAGFAEIPAIVRKVNNQAAQAIALIENVQREDLNALEQAEALQRLLDEHQMTHQQLADAIGKSRAAVTNFLRLNDVQAEIKPMLVSGELDMGHARALLSLDKGQQLEVAEKIARQGLNVRQAEALVKAMKNKGIVPAVRHAADPDVQRLEGDVSSALGASVQIRHSKQGAGQIVIKYSSLDQFDGILERFGLGGSR